MEVFHNKDFLTCFGEADLHIQDDCNINENSESDLGYGGYYETPQGIKK
jgi:hypothetical protein